MQQLTQPNLPIIDPRGIEIIKRSQFKESLKLLDNVVTMTKETLNSPKLQSSHHSTSPPGARRDEIKKLDMSKVKVDLSSSLPEAKEKKLTDVVVGIPNALSSSSGSSLSRADESPSTKSKKHGRDLKNMFGVDLTAGSSAPKDMKAEAEEFGKSCKAIEKSTQAVVETFEQINEHHSQMRQTLLGIVEDQRQTLEHQEQIKESLGNVAEVIQNIRRLKQEILKRPRPVVDAHGNTVHQAVKSELNRGFMQNIFSKNAQQVRPMHF